jgi:hypothetical protein
VKQDKKKQEVLHVLGDNDFCARKEQIPESSKDRNIPM